MKLFLFFLFTVLAFPVIDAEQASACLNDRDTLAEEVQGLPDVTRVITGRFERNPSLYYEMRVKRVTEELRIHDDILDDYDDAAVACDHLGRDDEAIAFETKKRHVMEQMRDDTPGIQEEWYKYWANTGTCRVHRWIRAGANRKNLSEVIQAKKEIEEALKIKPDAHFGREKYQAAVMQWIIDPSGRESTQETNLTEDLMMLGDKPKVIQKGLCGLIVLGNAWESPDIFRALMGNLSYRQSHLRDLCMLRVKEMEGKGRHSLVASTKALSPGANESVANIDPYDISEFKVLRSEADAWQSKRTAFMMARLTTGRHPDTDPRFWDGYVDAGPPVLSVPITRRIELWGRPYFGIQWFPRLPIAIILFSLPVIWLFRREIRSLRERRRIYS